jgi:CO/xanthine dehydrogenase Mo-binding subunit
MRGLLVVEIRADVADVRIREADNLAGITGVGEYFLVAGEAGIKNNFAAATGVSTRRTPVKYAPVLERENRGGSVEPQVVLRLASL